MSLPRLLLSGAILCGAWAGRLHAAGGSLTVTVADESDGEPTITRMELWPAASPNRLLSVRKSVPAGYGLVLDRRLQLALPDADYQFRMIRGPEYRIISGNFALEKTSLDEHRVQLPRMVNMLREGWTSGDCCVPASPYSLPLRMASEDLHVAAVLGRVDAKPIPGRGRNDLPQHDPSWIRTDAKHLEGLLFYGAQSDLRSDDPVLAAEQLVEATREDHVRVAVENPFAWALPVWLASGQIDGFFVLGDWLSLDRQVLTITNGRPIVGPGTGDARAVGRWAERVYWNILEAGLQIPPLAGCGDLGRNTPVGYNRLYVTQAADDPESGTVQPRRVGTAEQWWQAAWLGQSVATNGPLLRPTLGGKIPGHVFSATGGEVLRLTPELTLTVRDPVDYLEVIHNGRVHYSARLDEFARQGGTVPPLHVTESGWVTVRVVTLFEDHFRAAMSAPWYIVFDSKPRVTAEAVEFFRRWLSDYEQRLKRLPPQDLKRHVPYVRAARSFWSQRNPEPGS